MHLDYGEDARVLLNGVTCTVSETDSKLNDRWTDAEMHWPSSVAVSLRRYDCQHNGRRRPKNIRHLLMRQSDHITAGDPDKAAERLQTSSISNTARLHVSDDSLATHVETQLSSGVTARHRQLHRLHTPLTSDSLINVLRLTHTQK